MLRVERKFRAQSADPESAVALMQTIRPDLVRVHSPRIIHSLYFDDSSLRNCRDHFDSAGYRSKYRIRWYKLVETDGRLGNSENWKALDDLKKCKNVNFETKLRIGSLISKSVAEKPSGQIDDLSRDFCAVKNYEALSRLAGVGVSKPDFLRPVIIVSYKRGYFEFAGTSIRITVDSNLRYAAFNGFGLPSLPSIPSTVIVEMKCAPEDLVAASACIGRFPWLEVPFSKYMAGVSAGHFHPQ